MSRRYGRNQKRKHREHITELESKETALNKSIDDLVKTNSKLERQLLDTFRIIKRICPNSIAIPVEDYHFDWAGREYLERAVYSTDEVMFTDQNSFPDINSISFERINLYELELSLSKSIDFKRSIHLRYKSYDGKHVAYCLSEEGLRYVSNEQLENQIGPMVTEALIYELKRGYNV